MKRRVAALLLGASLGGCATRGHIATPDEVALLERAKGLSASGKLTLSGPRGKFSARVVFGVARPDALRIEIPAGTGLRFLLIAKEGRLRADLPEDDAMFEGPGTREVMRDLFGIDLSPSELVDAILGPPPASILVDWRFRGAVPARVSIRGLNRTRLSLSLEDSAVEAPGPRAFEFGRARGRVFTLGEMSERLGLTR